MTTLMLAWPGCPVYNMTDDGLRWCHSRSYDAGSAPLVPGCVYPAMRIVTENGINLSGTFSVYYTGTGGTVQMTLAGESRPWPVEWVVAEAMHVNATAAATKEPTFLQTVEGQAALAAACAMYAVAKEADPSAAIALAWQGNGWRLVNVGPGTGPVQPYYVGQYRSAPHFSTDASPPALWRPTMDPDCWWASC